MTHSWVLKSTLGDTFDPLHSFLNNPLSTWSADKPHHSQAWWTEKCHESSRRILLATVEGRDASRLAAQGSGIGSFWMQVIPSDEGSNRIPRDEYRIALRWTLDLPMLGQAQDGATCPACHSQVDIYGDHLMCCRKNNFYGRHFAVQEAFITMAQAADQPYEREVALPAHNSIPHGPALRPADLLLKAWQGGVDTAIDFTISHPLQASQKPWSADKARAFVTLQEAQKKTKYTAACKAQGWEFIPAAFDTWGGMGSGAKSVLSKLLKRAVAGTSLDLRAARAQELKQHLSLALMRQVWRLLAAKNNFS